MVSRHRKAKEDAKAASREEAGRKATWRLEILAENGA